jgi:hypothetical protein
MVSYSRADLSRIDYSPPIPAETEVPPPTLQGICLSIPLPRDPTQSGPVQSSQEPKRRETIRPTSPSEDHQEKAQNSKASNPREDAHAMHDQGRGSGGESKQESRVMECVLHSQEQAVIGRVLFAGSGGGGSLDEDRRQGCGGEGEDRG